MRVHILMRIFSTGLKKFYLLVGRFVLFQFAKNEESSSALANWPPNNIRDGVKHWLEEQNVFNANDILDGACEPLARYLSYQMKMEVKHAKFNSISKTSHTLKSKLELLDPRERVPSCYLENIFVKSFLLRYSGDPK